MDRLKNLLYGIEQELSRNQEILQPTDFSNDDSKNTEHNTVSLLSENTEPDKKNINEFLGMALTALRSMSIHAKQLYDSVDDTKIAENLTEAWVLAKIAVMQDQMDDIHHFVMFSEKENKSVENSKDSSLVMSKTEDELDLVDTQIAKPGLWDNIRKKKDREGKKYKPAKPGDKDRPDSDQWKKLTK